jgi:hypothetical protein
MGTRSETHIRTSYEREDGTKHGDVVELWRHWDGSPDSMIELFENFAKEMPIIAGNQPHRMQYAQDMAALLIVYDAYQRAEGMEKLATHLKDEISKSMIDKLPDMRPRGNIDDAEYIYLLELTFPSERYDESVLVVKVYDDGDWENLRASFKTCTEPEPSEIKEIPVVFQAQSGVMMF